MIQMTGSLQPPGFFPALLTTHVNDYIIFVNLTSPPEIISITAGNGAFSSPPIGPGKSWTLTISNPGEYTYHDTTASARMVGEIIVVPESITLLPTPQPAVAATALALIESGKTPPDTLANVTPTPAATAVQAPVLPARSLLAKELLPVSIGLALMVALFIGILLARRSRRRKQAEVQDEAPAAPVETRKRHLAWLKWHRPNEDDDLEDIDDDI